MTRSSFILCISIVTFFISHCSCVIENVRVLKCYEEYFNRENSNFTYEDGILYNMEKLDSSRYKVEITIKVKEQANPKSFCLLKCTATLYDDAGTLTVEENQCDDGTIGGRSTNEAADESSEPEYSPDETTEFSTTESDVVGRQALNLDSEVQSDNLQINGSEEQFVAIPRPQPSSPCIGCSSLVDNNAPGVEELAKLAIRHLNKHSSDITYKLKSTLQVERQVQIVNGVRYVLTIDVSDLNCVKPQAEDCSVVKTCKVSILEKPWLKMPNGKKFRAVLSNNCTKQWLFGEDGEELTKDDDVANLDDEFIKVNKNIDVQATPNSERKLTGQALKELEDQIIPTNEIERQKRYVKTKSGAEVVLEPKSVNLPDLAVRACYSFKFNQPGQNFSKLKVKCESINKKPVSGSIKELDSRDSELKDFAIMALKTKYLDLDYYDLSVVYANEEVTHDLITRIDCDVSDLSKRSDYRCHIKSFVRLIENKRNITVNCFDKGTNDDGRRELNASDPQNWQDAQESLAKQYGSSLYLLEVLRVTTRGAYSGINETDFDAISQTNNVVYRCHNTIFINMPGNFKDTELLCEPSFQKPMRYKAIKKVNPLGKRMPGSKYEKDPKNPIYLKLAEKSLSQYLNTENVETQYNITIAEVTNQLHAGVSTDIYFSAISNDNSGGFKCHCNIWERGWIRSLITNVTCSPLRQLGRIKREIFNGKTQQDLSNPQYLSLARKSLNQYLKQNTADKHHQITIKYVTTQLVAGISTEIDFIAKHLNGSSAYKCHSNIWERAWLDSTIIDVNCSSLQLIERKKRENRLQVVAGGKKSQDPSDPQYLTLARKSLNQYLKENITSNQLQITINYVTTQVVAGISTDIDFIAKYPNNSETYKCHSNIWERAWLDSTIINVNCSSLKVLERKKRENSLQVIAGGKKSQDASDPQYLTLARKSLNQYLKENITSNQLQITINYVTTQVVAGISTDIDFIAKYPNNSEAYKCHSNIWERVWLKSTIIKVDCSPLYQDISIRTSRSTAALIQKDPSDRRIKRSISSTKENNDVNNTTTDNEDIIKADHFANEALKYINAKYRFPRQMKVISIFSFTKDHTSAHYRIKMEVGFTNCLALSPMVEDCSLVSDMGANKYCRVSVWLQPKGDQPPRFKVSCDIDEHLIELNKKTQAEHLFFNFLTTHKPAYLNNFDEMRRRLEIFKENIEKIHELNTHERGTARYAVTKFSDLNDEEFSTKYLGLKQYLASSNSMTKAKIPNVALPTSFDWREKGAVTEVKNQGQCGSCWAFSVTGNIEGQWKLKSGQLVSLSEQELVDCDTLDQGCSGGLPDNAYRAIEQLGGLETEQDYPYEAENDKCTYNKTLSKVQISGAVNITTNETSMAMWMVEHGPISIGLNANAMQFYMGGVSHPWKVLCNPKNLDHGVLIVGYGIKEYPLFKKSLPYWIIKNSWGPSWGEQGYYRLYRGDGTCGVDQMASSAVIN